MLGEGQRVAEYTILRLIGSGGMGEVYLAQHPRLPRQDALKILARDLSTSGEFHERFIREADLAAKLFHPSIVGVHDRGDHDGQLWIAMDYVDGPDAAKLSRKYPAGMPVEDVIAIIDPVASALDYAHRSGLLHRDVKPANILLAAPEDDGQRVFLADFGISRQVGEISGLTATNLTLGTVAYCAPEQLMGTQIDGRADQYALGATAFHLLTGTPPYEGTNPVAVISNHLNAAIPRISGRCPELAALDPVFAKVLAKQPEDRFSSCRDFAAALRQALRPAAAPWAHGGQSVAEDAAAPTMAAEAFAAAPTNASPAPDRPTQIGPPTPRQSAPAALQDTPSTPPNRRKKPLYIGGAVALTFIALVAFVLSRPSAPQSPQPDAAAGGKVTTGATSGSAATRSTGRPAATSTGDPAATASPPAELALVGQAQIDRNGSVIAPPSGVAPATPVGDGSAVCPTRAIAVVGALAGPDRALGINIKNGAQLAVDTNNAANPNCQIQIRTFDTGGDPQKALTVVPQLIADPSIIATIGPAFSGEYKATGGLFNDAELVAATPSATNVSLAQQGWRTFVRGVANDLVQGPAMGNYMSRTLALKKVCVIQAYSTYGLEFGRTVLSGLLDAVDAACSSTINPDRRPLDFSTVIAEVRAQSPDALFYSGYWAEAAELIRQLRATGFSGLFISGDGSKEPAFIDSAGDASQGAILSCPCAASSGDFSRAYIQAFNQQPGSFSPEGYDLATIFIQGVKAGAVTRPAMLNFVRNYTGQGVGRTYSWAADGELTEPLIWTYRVQ
jgi:serine/threonine protein kinase/ABC-type branched-subunit amino acid transport system substrate-binding protein